MKTDANQLIRWVSEQFRRTCALFCQGARNSIQKQKWNNPVWWERGIIPAAHINANIQHPTRPPDVLANDAYEVLFWWTRYNENPLVKTYGLNRIASEQNRPIISAVRHPMTTNDIQSIRPMFFRTPTMDFRRCCAYQESPQLLKRGGWE